MANFPPFNNNALLGSVGQDAQAAAEASVDARSRSTQPLLGEKAAIDRSDPAKHERTLWEYLGNSIEERCKVMTIGEMEPVAKWRVHFDMMEAAQMALAEGGRIGEMSAQGFINQATEIKRQIAETERIDPTGEYAGGVYTLKSLLQFASDAQKEEEFKGLKAPLSGNLLEERVVSFAYSATEREKHRRKVQAEAYEQR